MIVWVNTYASMINLLSHSITMQDRIKQEQTRMKLNSDMEKFWSIEMKVIAVFTVPNVSHAYKEAAAIQ